MRALLTGFRLLIHVFRELSFLVIASASFTVLNFFGLSITSFHGDLGFRKIGFEKEDIYFVKQMGKAMLCTYTLFGAAWLWNETSPLGWWTLKPRPKVRAPFTSTYLKETCFFLLWAIITCF